MQESTKLIVQKFTENPYRKLGYNCWNLPSCHPEAGRRGKRTPDRKRELDA